MKRFVLLAFLSFIAYFLKAQELQSEFETLYNDPYGARYVRYDYNEEACAVLRISVSDVNKYKFSGNIIGDIIYGPGEAIIYMTARSRFINISSDKFGTRDYEFPESLQPRMCYRLTLKVILSEDQKTRTLVMPVIGLGETMSYGAMVGVVKKTGVYAKVKYNFQSLDNNYECNDLGVIAGTDNYNSWFTGENKIARFAITAGLLQRLWKPAYLYVGAGYGYKRLGWELDSGEWAENSDKTCKGIEAEVGGIYRIKNFALSAGVQTNSFKYWEATVGLGIMF